MEAINYHNLPASEASLVVAKQIRAKLSDVVCKSDIIMDAIEAALDEAFKLGITWQRSQPVKPPKEVIKMKPGRIYYIQYSGSTQVVGRFKGDSACNYFFTSLLHNWNGYESFRMENGKPPYCVHGGIELIREASLAEKQSLIRHELENNAC